MSDSDKQPCSQWENSIAGAIAGFATVASVHPLDVVRTRFQVNDGRLSCLPTYKNTLHAIFTIARMEGLKGLYAGFIPAVFGSSISWGLYFLFYSRAKQRFSNNGEEKLNPGYHLASAVEAGALVAICTNPIWVVKTRLQLQAPLHQNRTYSGIYDAVRTSLKEEGWSALYKGFLPGLFLVSHAAIQFTVYEELRKLFLAMRSKESKTSPVPLNSVDIGIIGGTSKLAAILVTYPFQVIRTRLQQRPSVDNGSPRYMNTWHVVKETRRYEGLQGFYKGITPSILKNVPASSLTFVVYENVLKMMKLARNKEWVAD